ncbi:hypothetical protein [Stieleria varia]|nr:hypothetical protein [Stieleria varia]
MARSRFRSKRLLHRIRSPRRILATAIALAFFFLYLINGVFVMSSRAAADPERLRLWLSGGMVLYMMYHAVRCVWSRRLEDLEFSEAEKLWLGGAPIQRSSLAVYYINGVFIGAIIKTLLLVVLLASDVPYPLMLAIGVFVSLLLLEILRLTWQRWSEGLSDRQRRLMRVAMSGVGIAAVMQIIAQLALVTPAGSSPGVYVLNSFQAIGRLASCDAVQWLSLPWYASSSLTVTSEINLQSIAWLTLAIGSIPLAVKLLIAADDWSQRQQLLDEQTRLASGCYGSTTTAHAHKANTHKGDERWSEVSTRWISTVQRWMPSRVRDSAALIWRQSISVRRYSGTILFSFIVPTLLCLSPLMTGGVQNQWAYVIGGIAMCTMLLAPPALRIDFRRDLRRMLLLRGLPLRPLSTVAGQITLPVLITLCFQWVTIAIAAVVTGPGVSQVVVWTGMLAALAVGTFAAENALFLTYPHHERAQGIVMVIRANVVFLGKVLVISLCVAALLIWMSICKQALPDAFVLPVYAIGAIAMTWTLAAMLVMGTAWCWRRFDLSCDMPPQ